MKHWIHSKANQSLLEFVINHQDIVVAPIVASFFIWLPLLLRGHLEIAILSLFFPLLYLHILDWWLNKNIEAMRVEHVWSWDE